MNYNNLIGKFIDPPSGWMYGFPKKFEPLPNETLEEWLVRKGYPEEDVSFALKYLRVIY